MSACLERKLTLSGETKDYSCELVSLRDGIGVLRYIIDRAYDVDGFLLAPGDATLALYWKDRPYTLYVWFRRAQKDRAYYFNIADSVSLSPGEFRWRDLAVDILVDPSGKARVLDEHELPPDLPADLASYIREARDQVLKHFHDIIREADESLRKTGVLS